MANQIRFDVGFNVDRTGLNQIQQQLNSLKSLTQGDILNLNKGLKADQAKIKLQELRNSITQMETALKGAFNTDLGTLNIAKFNQSLKSMNLQAVQKGFANAGLQGQAAFRNIATQVLTTNLQLRQTNTFLQRAGKTLFDAAKWSIAYGGINAMTQGVRNAYSYVKELDTSLNDIRIVTEKSAEEMDVFAEKANKAAKTLGKATNEYTKASLIFFQQGLEDQEVEARTEVTLKAANVTGQSTDEVSEQLTAIWNGYKVSAEEVELYIDKVAAVAASTAADLEELSVGMSKVASAANLMGVDMDQLNAILSTVVSVTRQAPESIGTAFKTIFARIADVEAGLDEETTLGDYTEKIKEISGIDILDANKQIRDMGDVITEVGEKWSSMSKEQQLALAQAMAGTRQYNNLLALFENWDMYSEALETSRNSMGTLQKQQDIYMESTAAHLNQLKASSEDLYDSLLDADGINPVIDALSDFTSLISNVVDGIGGMGSALMLVGIIAMKAFGPVLSNAIATFVLNLKNAKDNAIQMQAIKDVTAQFGTVGKTNLELQHLVSMKKEILQIDKYITDEERNAANELIKQQNEIYKQRDGFKEAGEAAKQIAIRLGEAQQGLTVMNPNRVKGMITRIGSGITDIGTDIKDRNAAQKAFNKDGGMENVNFDANSQSVQNYIQKINSLSNSNNLNEKSQIRLKEALNEFKNGVQTGTEGAQAYQKVLTIVDEELQKTDKTLKNAKQSLETLSSNLAQNTQRAEQNAQAWANFMTKANMKAAINTTMNMVSGVGQLAMAYTSFKQIGEIWNNEQLSTGEKYAQLLTSISMMLPMGVSGLKSFVGGFKELGSIMKAQYTITQLMNSEGLKQLGVIGARSKAEAVALALKNAGIPLSKKELKNLTDENALEILNNKIKEQGNKQTIKDNALTNLNTVAKDLQAKSTWQVVKAQIASNLYMLAAVAIVAAVAAAIYGLVKAHNAEADAVKKAAEEEKKAQEIAKKAREEYEQLKNTLSEYDKLTDGMKELTKGTDEYREALEKANEKAMELILSNQELAKYAIRDTDTGLITFQDENGDEFDTDELLEKSRQKANNAQAASYLATVKKNQAQQELNLTQAVRSEELKGAFGLSTGENIAWGVAAAFNPGNIWNGVNAANQQEEIDKDVLEKVITKIQENGGNITNQELASFGFDNDTLKILQEETDALIKLAETNKSLDKTNKLLLEQSLENALLNDERYSLLTDNQQRAVAGIYSEDFDEDTYNKIRAEQEAIIKAQTREATKRQYAELQGWDWVSGNKYLDENNEQQKIAFKVAEEAVVRDATAKAIAKYNGTNLDLIYSGVGKLSNNTTTEKALLDFFTDKDLDSSNLTAEDLIAVQGYQNKGELIQLFEDLSTEELRAMMGELAEGVADADLIEVVTNAFTEEFDKVDFEQAYSNSAKVAQNRLTKTESALSTLQKGEELSPEDIAALREEYTELEKIKDASSREFLEAFEELREADEATAIINNARAMTEAYEKLEEKIVDVSKVPKDLAEEEEWEKAITELNEFGDALDNYFDRKYELEIEMTEDIITDVDDAISEIKALQTAAASIGEGFQVAASDAEELFKWFPELATGAEVLASGTVQLNQQAAEEILGTDVAANNERLKNAIETRIAELELKKQDVEAELAIIQSKTAAEIDWNELLADEKNELFKKELDAQSTNLKNNGLIAEGVIKNWAEQEKAAIKYSQTVHDVYSGKYVTEPNVDIDAFNIETSISDPYELKDDELNEEEWLKRREELKEQYEIHLANAIASYERQIADLTVSYSQLNNEEKQIIEKSKEMLELLLNRDYIFHDIDIIIKRLTYDLNKLQDAEDGAFGQDRIDNLNAQLNLLEQLNEASREKIKIAETEAEFYRGVLAAEGVEFKENGDISNYIAIMREKQAYMNAVTEKYNDMSEDERKTYKDTYDQTKKEFDQFKENVEAYENLVVDMIPDLQQQIRENAEKMTEINIDKFTYSVELRLEMAEAAKDWNEFKRKIIDDIDDDNILGNALANFDAFKNFYDTEGFGTGPIQSLTEQLTKTLEEHKKLNETGASDIYGTNEVKLLEDMKNYTDELMSQLQDMDEMIEEIKQNYLDMIDEAIEKFDKQINQYEYVSDLINHDMNMIKLLYGEDEYDALGNYYEDLEKNNLNRLDFLRQQTDMFKEMMDAEENPEAREKWEEAWKDSLSNLNSAVEDSVQTIIDSYANTINKVFKDLDNKITNGLGLDRVKEQWDLINKKSDMYLDTVNRTYQLQKLENRYLTSINEASSVGIQTRLNKLMSEQLTMLREKDKLTQYDLDRANAMYELELKRIALAEAERNKSEMRLRRDSQGNYSYEFVANQDAIDTAQSELDDAMNSLYNMDKDAYKENLNSIYSLYEEFKGKVLELYLDQTLSAEERDARIYELQQEYGEMMNILLEENEYIKQWLQESTFIELEKLYGEDQLAFQDMNDIKLDIWDTSLQHMADAFAGEGGLIPTCQEAFYELIDTTIEYQNSLDELQQVANVDFKAIREEGYDPTIQMAKGLLSDNSLLIKQYKEDMIPTIQDVIKKVQDLQAEYKEATAEALTMAAAAHIAWMQENDEGANFNDGFAKNITDFISGLRDALKDALSEGVDVEVKEGNDKGSSTTEEYKPHPGYWVDEKNYNQWKPAKEKETNSETGSSSFAGKESSIQQPKFESGDYVKFNVDAVGDAAMAFIPSLRSENPFMAQLGLKQEVNNKPWKILDITESLGEIYYKKDVGAWFKESQLMKVYRTGGLADFTGPAWLDGTKSQPELVLNSSDTQNILSAVSLIRDMDGLLAGLNQNTFGRMAALLNLPNIMSGVGRSNDTIEQNVHIDATFPNVRESREIEEAFNNLVNIATQRAFKTER